MDTPRSPMVVTAVVRLEGALSWGDLLVLFDERVLVHERMRARVVARSRWLPHLPFWRESSVTARDQLTRVTLASAGASDADLAALVSDLMNRPLDMSQPPWRAWLVEGGRDTVLVFRIHHVLADGLALLELLGALCDEGAIRAASSPSRTPPPSQPRPSVRARATAAARLLTAPLDAPSSLTGALSGRKRIAWSKPFELARVRDAARRAGAHVNAVFLAALSGAVAPRTAPSAPPLHVLVPVALPRESGALRNHYVSLFVPLPVASASPMDRVRAAQAAVDDARARAGIPLGEVLVAGAALLGPLGERLAVRVLSRKASLVASNVAGPSSPLHLGGHLVTDVMFAAPAPGAIALSLNLMTYRDALRVTVATDTAIVPDPAVVVHRVEEELDRVVDALGDR